MYDINKIYPYLKHMDGDGDSNAVNVLDNNGNSVEVNLPFHHLTDDIAVMYLVDNGENFVLADMSLMNEFDNEQSLFECACQNLSRDIEYRIVETNWGALGLLADGNFEASSLCLPYIWDYVADIVSEDIIIGVPARDVVLMIPASDMEKLARLKETVDQIYNNGDHTISDNLLIYNITSKEFSKYKQ